MSAHIFALTPQWIMFDDFWIAIKRRNRWLVVLRYGAAAMLGAFALGSYAIPGLTVAVTPIVIVAAAILAYNLVLHKLLERIPSTHAPFHGLHFALIQISADLVSLMAIIHLTGGIESPFFLFFIFHIIIGSLILPSSIVAVIITAALSVMLAGTLLEFNGIIPHHSIDGLHSEALYLNSAYITVRFSVYTFTMYLSNFLANSISKELYLRERSLTEAYRELEEAEKTKSRYVMSVVHDLKTPIAAAITYINMILDKTFGAVKEEMERPLERSKVRLTGAITLINDILQLSQVKLASGVQTGDVNLTDMIAEIYDEMRILFTSRRIRFSTWTNAAHDVHVEADARLLKLALSNMISNAYKYTDPEGAVEVHIKQEGSKVTIEIADSGIGIPQSEQDKIFEDFFRTSLSKKRTTEGTGLGLSIVQQIVQQLDGTISVKSPSRLEQEGRPGTSFHITLPRRPDDRQSATVGEVLKI